MIQSLPKYLQRSPRYVLRPADETLIRFSGPQNQPWEEGTQIKNISLSGLVFTAPSDLCPSIGELIKIQFEIPGGRQMACFALVTRLEPETSSRFQVGIKFHQLELGHRILLTQSIASGLRTQQSQEFRSHILRNKAKLALALGLLLSWSLLFYLLVR